MSATFSELGIKTELVSALTKLSITEPTAIQIEAIPALLEGKGAYLQAETGTGKTLAYLLPLYTKIDPAVPNVQVIVLAPTHELAIQIQRQCNELAQLSGLPIRTVLLIGGTSTDRQLDKLKNKPHIIVGSLGRIRELIDARKLKTHLVNTIVVDEADRQLAAENLSDLQVIIKSTPKSRRFIFVSATELPGTAETVSALSADILKIKTGATINSNIDHLYLVCKPKERTDQVRKLIHALPPGRTIVFVHTAQEAELLARKLAHHKINVIDIHGTMGKEERKKAMDRIRSGKVDVLIASDVAARGLDIKGVTLVVNYDVPTISEAYLHRTGRTGRAGAKGIAVSLVSEDLRYLMQRYEKDLGITMKEVDLWKGEVYAVEGQAPQEGQ